MTGAVGLALALVAALQAAQAPDDLPEVRVEGDDTRLTRSCRLILPDAPIFDLTEDGVIHVVGDDLVIDLGGGTLLGRPAETPPWERGGMGIVVQGRNVTIRNGAVRGFRVGILATGADGFTAEDLDLSGNWGAKLLSTSAAEDGADWLWPHANDRQEWRTRYGAALCIERSKGVTVRRVKAVGRGAQNGIILDRVDDSKVYDSDGSFLSGWGLAMWRSSRNVITRNAFDFCVRGYSHGVYNRGQDSAGILMFEQCCDNLIAFNSVTHGGDGLFIFAGNEALGPELPEGTGPDDPRVVASKGRGCNRNVILDNDFSHAVAHGVEVTFSFDNQIGRNQFRECGITGIWGGYSRGTEIVMNAFERHGVHPGNPGEEAAISAEHASDLFIFASIFRNQGVAIKLWWDEDPGLLRKAWALANGAECHGSVIHGNQFIDCGTAIDLERCDGVKVGRNTFDSTARTIEVRHTNAPAEDRPQLDANGQRLPTDSEQRYALCCQRNAKQFARVLGERSPCGARASLGGREAIIITPSGPYDWAGPLLQLESSAAGVDRWRVLGPAAVRGTKVQGRVSLELAAREASDRIGVVGTPGWVAPYRLVVQLEGGAAPLEGRGTVVDASWTACFFPWTKDPRQDLEGWRLESAKGVTAVIPAMDLHYGGEGPSQVVAVDGVRAARLPKDRFGMIARTKLGFPPGRWRLRVTSDDGVRLRADGFTLIERWDWHGPTEDVAKIQTAEARTIDLELEHFELDGHAQLTFAVEPIAEPPVPNPAPAAPPAVPSAPGAPAAPVSAPSPEPAGR